MPDSNTGTATACLKNASTLLDEAGVDARLGLSHAAASAAMRQFGPNELSAKEEDPMWKRFVDKLKEPMIVLLLLSAGLSILTGQYDDAISISLAVLIVITVACVQEYKSDQSLAALSKLAPHACHVRREGRLMDVEASQLVPNDIVLISAGDRVPADLRLLEVVDLSIDESSLTGENEPSEKTSESMLASHQQQQANGSSPANSVPAVADRHNCAFMGTLVSTGRGVGIVVETGMGTELGSIMASMDEAEERKSPLQTKMDALSQKLATISMLIIGGISLIGIIQRKPILEMFTIGVSLAVAAIPEGLPIVVTVTLALGVQRMANKRAVVKKLPAVEALGCTSVLAMDKTGTLTRNEQTVVEAFTLAPPLAWLSSSSSSAPAASSTGSLLLGSSSNGPAASGDHHNPHHSLWRAASTDSVTAHHLLHDTVLGRGGLIGGVRVLFSGLGYHPGEGKATYVQPQPPTPHAHAYASAIVPTGSIAGSGVPSAPITASNDQQIAVLMEAAAVCNNAEIRLVTGGGGGGGESVAVAMAKGSTSSNSYHAELSGQPTEGALLTAAAKVPLASSAATSGFGSSSSSSLGGLATAKSWYHRTFEAPFSSETKWMAVRAKYIPQSATTATATTTSTSATSKPVHHHHPTASPSTANIHHSVAGETVFAKGAVEAILALCDFTVAPANHPQALPLAYAEAVRGEALKGIAATGSTTTANNNIGFSVAPLDVTSRAAVLAAAETMAREGLRVIALAKGDHVPSGSRYSGPAGSAGRGGIAAAAAAVVAPAPSPMAAAVGSSAAGPSATSSGRATPAVTAASAAADGALIAPSSTAIGGLCFLGLVGLHDPPREGVIETLPILQEAGVRTCMITGDSMPTAISIATHLGLIREPSNNSNKGAFPHPSPPSSSSSSTVAAGLGRFSNRSTDVGAAHEVDIEAVIGGGHTTGVNGGGAAVAVNGPASSTTSDVVALSGSEIESMSEGDLAALIAASPRLRVFYRTTPKHKMKLVNAFQRAGHVVAMTGDGINDSIALRVADIGIAMGKVGTDVAKEAADVVLLDDDLRTLIPAIEEGKGIFANIRNFVRFQLSTSVAALLLVAICTTLGLPQPLNAMQILFINLIMDGPPAQSLGVEPVSHDVLKQPPRPSTEPIITFKLLRRVVVAAITVVIGTLLILHGEYNEHYSAMVATAAGAGALASTAAASATTATAATAAASGAGSAAATAAAASASPAVLEAAAAAAAAVGSSASLAVTLIKQHATTMTFACFVCSDMFNALSCRSFDKSVFNLPNGLFGNKLFLWSVGGSIVGQLAVIYLPFLQAIFQTTALGGSDWIRIIITASAVLWVDEGMKIYDGLSSGSSSTVGGGSNSSTLRLLWLNCKRAIAGGGSGSKGGRAGGRAGSGASRAVVSSL
jgi:magnesium-transporting ATPase (P-type)